MPTRNPKPFSWRPAGCTDAMDGSEAFEGAMLALKNMVPSQRTNRNWVCRPAAILIADIGSGQPITGEFIVGDVAYGFVGDGAGHDLPWAYNLGTHAQLPVTLANPALVITSQPTTGDWTPPTFTQVGPRILTTHPGFSDVPFNSGNSASWTATANTGSAVLDGGLTPASPGDPLFGTSIAPGATILTIFNGQLGQALHTATITNGTNVAALASFTGAPPMPGFAISSGPFLGIAGIVTSFDGTNVTFTGPAALNDTTTGNLTWSGSVVTMSANAIGNSPAAGETVSSATTFLDPTGASRKFGYFDISNASIPAIAQLFLGSPTISLTSAFGLQPGMAVSGTGIPAGTFLRYLRSPTFRKAGTPPASQSMTLNIKIADSPGNLPLIGQVIDGPGITTGTQVAGTPVIIGFDGSFYTASVPLSLPASGGADGAINPTYTFSGNTIGALNNSATVSGFQTLTFSGGTPSNPTFAIIDTAYNPLPSKPVAVTITPWGAALFACGVDGMPYTDSLLPIQRSFASQAIVPGDGLAITALGSLPLNAPLTGGIIDAVIAFAGNSKMYQITGAPQLGTLTMNPMNVAVGTEAPLSIVPSNFGLAFISPEGMRVIGFDGTISDPIGDAGTDQGVSFIFQNTPYPSRICAASNADTIRFSVINATGGRFEEWCFDIARKRWYGPQTAAYSHIASWRHTFVGTPAMLNQLPATPGQLFNADLVPDSASIYLENFEQLDYQFQTVLLPDNPNQEARAIIESSIYYGNATSSHVTFTAEDDDGGVLDVVSLQPSDALARQRFIPWKIKLVFRQLSLILTGVSNATLVLGRINLRYEELGYPLPKP